MVNNKFQGIFICLKLPVNSTYYYVIYLANEIEADHKIIFQYEGVMHVYYCKKLRRGKPVILKN